VTEPLSDDEVNARLFGAMQVLGSEPAKTVRGLAAMTAARNIVTLLRVGFAKAVANGEDEIECLSRRAPSPPESPQPQSPASVEPPSEENR
jgi:hypothetical protein